MLNIHKARFFEILSAKHGRVRIRAKLRKCLNQSVGKLLNWPVFRNRIIIRRHISVHILELYPSAGFDVRVCLLEECDWRFEDRNHVAEVDKVKVFAI